MQERLGDRNGINYSLINDTVTIAIATSNFKPKTYQEYYWIYRYSDKLRGGFAY